MLANHATQDCALAHMCSEVLGFCNLSFCSEGGWGNMYCFVGIVRNFIFKFISYSVVVMTSGNHFGGQKLLNNFMYIKKEGVFKALFTI